MLDCACGIGTQALGLAALGHRVTGTDLSPVAAARARREAGARGLATRFAAADMRALPFGDAAFEVVVCADNSLPHLLTAHDVLTALREMRRVLRPGGLVLVSTRPYDETRRSKPRAAPPGVAVTPEGRVISFQLWDWHADGERYDVEHLQVLPEGDSWVTRVRRMTYWAMTSAELVEFAGAAGFRGPAWVNPEESGLFQPVLMATR